MVTTNSQINTLHFLVPNMITSVLLLIDVGTVDNNNRVL
jgi:hypothetical protein